MLPGRMNAPPAPPGVLDAATIPVFAPIALELLKLVSQENVGLDTLAGLIRADAAVSVEVLRLANSPLYRARSEITGILHALAMLGLDRVKSMVMTVAIRDFLSPARDAAAFAACWRHCLATAFLAEEIAGPDSENRDNSYTAGLLHEVGQLALIAARPERYDLLVRLSREENRDLRQLEREAFGVDREGLELHLVDLWGLPARFREMLQGGLIRTACRLAGLLGFGAAGPDEPWDAGALAALPPEMLEDPACLEELAATIGTRINTLECSLAMV